MGKRTKQAGFADDLQRHFEAFCGSFLVPRVRNRKLSKPDEFLDDLNHNLASYLRPAVCVELIGTWGNNPYSLFKQITSKQECACFLGNGGGASSILTLHDAAQSSYLAGHVLSFEPGSLAYYEGEPISRKFLLVFDEKRRNAIRAMLIA